MREKSFTWKRAFARLFLLSMIGASIMLFYLAQQPSALELGDPLPNLRFHSFKGHEHLKRDGTAATAVIYFHTSCHFCQKLLQKMNDGFESLPEASFVFLTTESDFFEADKVQAWPKLASSPRIEWGVVDQDDVLKHLAPRVTPTAYVFSRAGRLTAKIGGETKLSKIMSELEKAGGPERWISGK